MKVLREGQCLRHARYGVGIATESNTDRTTIDFYEHGVKKFVTGMLDAELLTESPPRPPKPRAPKAPGPHTARKSKVAR